VALDTTTGAALASISQPVARDDVVPADDDDSTVVVVPRSAADDMTANVTEPAARPAVAVAVDTAATLPLASRALAETAAALVAAASTARSDKLDAVTSATVPTLAAADANAALNTPADVACESAWARAGTPRDHPAADATANGAASADTSTIVTNCGAVAATVAVASAVPPHKSAAVAEADEATVAVLPRTSVSSEKVYAPSADADDATATNGIGRFSENVATAATHAPLNVPQLASYRSATPWPPWNTPLV
jgi:hypothetical protein